MQQPVSNKIVIAPPIRTIVRIYDVNHRNYQSIPVILDTGATESLIPPQRLLDLGYDLANAPRITSDTANGKITILSVTVTRMEAIGQSTENIRVTCREPEANIPEPLERIGLLGMNFLYRFDSLHISFSKRTMSLT